MKKTAPPPESPAPFKVGDPLSLSPQHKSLFWDPVQPCVAVSVKKGRCMSGWLVEIATTNGPQFLDSGYFKLA